MFSVYTSCSKKDSEESESRAPSPDAAPRVVPRMEPMELPEESNRDIKTPRKIGAENGRGFRVEIEAGEGGRAFFEESPGAEGTEFLARAEAAEGWFFDRWVIASGAAAASLTASRLPVSAGLDGIDLKALFLPESGTLFVSSASEIAGTGSRERPFLSLVKASREAVRRISTGKSSTVEIRLAAGVYLLEGREALELVSGISIVGGYDPSDWLRSADSLGVGTASREDFAFDFSERSDFQGLSVVKAGRRFGAEAMIFISAEADGDFTWKQGAVRFDSLVIDGSLRPVTLISSTGVTPSLSRCLLKGYGEHLISGFDCGLELKESRLASLGDESVAVEISPAAVPGILIENSLFQIGSKAGSVEDGSAIRIYSPENLSMNRVRIVGNGIRSSVTGQFSGIEIENGMMICEYNRIESGRTSGVSRGIELKGEAVVNRNRIILDSEKGFGLSLKGSDSPSRILNNTIVTRSISSSGRMTACGDLEGSDLLISHNIFVNPQNESAAAIGIDPDRGGSRISHNSVISNNPDEKRWIIGQNGNTDQLPDRMTGATVSGSGVEVKPDFE